MVNWHPETEPFGTLWKVQVYIRDLGFWWAGHDTQGGLTASLFRNCSRGGNISSFSNLDTDASLFSLPKLNPESRSFVPSRRKLYQLISDLFIKWHPKQLEILKTFIGTKGTATKSRRPIFWKSLNKNQRGNFVWEAQQGSLLRRCGGFQALKQNS